MKKILLSLIFLSTGIASFCQKEISSIYGNARMFVNTDYVYRNFEKLLVITESIDLNTNKKIQAQFAKIGIPTVTSIDVMPPIKRYSEDDIMTICEKNNVDGIIRVNISSKEKGPARSLAQTLVELEVVVFDIQANLNAANFIGTSSAMKVDKAIHDYFRAIMPDLEPILKSRQ